MPDQLGPVTARAGLPTARPWRSLPDASTTRDDDTSAARSQAPSASGPSARVPSSRDPPQPSLIERAGDEERPAILPSNAPSGRRRAARARRAAAGRRRDRPARARSAWPTPSARARRARAWPAPCGPRRSRDTASAGHAPRRARGRRTARAVARRTGDRRTNGRGAVQGDGAGERAAADEQAELTPSRPGATCAASACQSPVSRVGSSQSPSVNEPEGFSEGEWGISTYEPRSSMLRRQLERLRLEPRNRFARHPRAGPGWGRRGPAGPARPRLARAAQHRSTVPPATPQAPANSPRAAWHAQASAAGYSRCWPDAGPGHRQKQWPILAVESSYLAPRTVSMVA